MITAETLRDALATALGDRIGTYTFPGEQPIPAIRIEDDADPYPGEPTVKGLEVVIVSSLDEAIKPLIGGYEQTIGMAIVLKQWDVTKTTLPELDFLLEVVAQFPELAAEQIRRVRRSTKINNIETLTMQVSQSFLSSF